MQSEHSAAEAHHDDGAVHVHVHPLSFYISVFVALIALTVITVLTSYVDIDAFVRPGTPHGAGPINLTLAMLIASTKAGLVVTFFMHLKDDSRFNAIIFFIAVLFVGIFMFYTMADTNHRGLHDAYNGVQVLPNTGERAPGGVTTVVPGELPYQGIEAPAAEEASADSAHH